MSYLHRLFAFSFLLFVGCQSKTKTLFTLVDNSGIDFQNNVSETKNLNVFNFRNFYNGGGVATGDLNNDGLPEVFFTSNQGANKLFLNKSNFKFEDISEKAGFLSKKQWSTGVVFADVNADGWLDIYVCNSGNILDSNLRKNQLFINNHNLTFTERAQEYGLADAGYSTQASFFDYDLDGDLDCFIINNSPIPVNTLNYANKRDLPASEWNIPASLKGGGDHLYKNENGKFIEVTKSAGIHGGLISLGLGINVSDINNDGYPDVYVSNDFFERDYLYINQKDGTFKDELTDRVNHTSLSSMGADIQDLDNNGTPEIFTTDMLPADDYRLKTNSSFENYDVFRLKQQQGFYNQYTQNALQVNDGSGNFKETSFYSGVAASDWSWGALSFDADNDGRCDVLVCNGIYRDVTDQDFIDFFANDVVQQMAITGKKEELTTVTEKMPSHPVANCFFYNKGALKFSESAKEWGLDQPSFSNGAAYADLDNDGDLDIVINNVNQQAFVYKNNANNEQRNKSLSLKINYQQGNLFGVGTVIKLYQKDSIISREIMPSRGFQSSVDYKLVIGLGNKPVDSIVIRWPNLQWSVVKNPAINKLNVLSYDSLKKENRSLANEVNKETLFSLQQKGFEKHLEDEFVDFYNERGVPFMLSRQGPKGAVGDVNGDGLDDVFIGGAKDQKSILYIQQSNGNFIQKPVKDFEQFSFNDVTAAVMFDFDKDGDLDIVTGGGGNFADNKNPNYQNMLYQNDGKGNFTLLRGALPSLNTNCGVLLPMDFDNDGFLDLFVGSRSIPQNYGAPAPAAILHNSGKGYFTDVTKSIAPKFDQLGMLTGAAYADVNGDGKNELIVTGEWMAPATFVYNGKAFEKVDNGLQSYKGLWQSMKMADIDKDGDIDLVLGNMGDNFYLNAQPEKPIKIFVKDFDNNGVEDKIITKTVNGKDVPVFMKREITEQIPSLKKANLTHVQYASNSIQDLFGSNIDGAYSNSVNYLSSAIAINNGKGQFVIKSLPKEVQLSCVNAIQVEDFNNDSYPDIVLAGNNMHMLPQFCTLDANEGIILLNNKKGGFTYLGNQLSGLHVKGETRDILSFTSASKANILFLRNDDFPQLYTFNPIRN